MPKYRLHGKCFITQYCHVEYPEKTKLATLTRCPSSENDCEGHEITLQVDEIVKAESPEDAIGNESLTQYEYSERIYGDCDGLEPTWCSTPICYEVK